MKSTVSLVIAFLFNFLPALFGDSTFWISFTTDRSAKYLMKIDTAGNIVSAPFKVSEGSKTHSGHATALSFRGTTGINLWFVSAFSGRVWRVVVDRNSLRTRSVIETNLTADPFGGDLRVAHSAVNDFLSFPVELDGNLQISAYPINEFGQIVGSKWLIGSPFCNDSQHLCKGGVGANGHLSYIISIDSRNRSRVNLDVQPLNRTGHSILNPVQIDHIVSQSATFWTITGADSTQTLLQQRKLVAYVKAPAPGTIPQSLNVAVIDSPTGQLLQPPFKITKREDFGQGVRIDPRGRFVLFIGNGSSASDQDHGLFFLPLDSTGHANGNAKLLTPLATGGIDLLAE